MTILCPSCLGKKSFLGMGFISEQCGTCKGIGRIEPAKELTKEPAVEVSEVKEAMSQIILDDPAENSSSPALVEIPVVKKRGRKKGSKNK